MLYSVFGPIQHTRTSAVMLTSPGELSIVRCRCCIVFPGGGRHVTDAVSGLSAKVSVRLRCGDSGRCTCRYPPASRCEIKMLLGGPMDKKRRKNFSMVVFVAVHRTCKGSTQRGEALSQAALLRCGWVFGSLGVAAEQTNPRRIDVHHHFSSPGFIKEISSRKTGQIPLERVDTRRNRSRTWTRAASRPRSCRSASPACSSATTRRPRAGARVQRIRRQAGAATIPAASACFAASCRCPTSTAASRRSNTRSTR